MNKPKLAFYTQGCRLNISETATLEQSFSNEGYCVVPFENGADIVIVNTCTVTENGDKDTRRLVNKINKINSSSKIALIGCQSQILKEKLFELKNVQWVIGNAEKMNLAQIISETNNDTPVINTKKLIKKPFTIKTSAIDKKHTRANLKIQDGCDFYCSFCVIPFARGPARSRMFEDIIREAIELTEAGHKEIVLTGVNIGTYEHNNHHFLDICKALVTLPKLSRLRISSIEPTTIPNELFDFMAIEPKMCRYLHIPIQSGSNTTLKAMSRKHSTKEFIDTVQYAYKTVEDICIGTDVIVGFPGETKANFDETVATLITQPVHYFHVFSYSERPLARSKKIEAIVDSQEIQRRSKVLRELSKKKKGDYLQQFIGKTVSVLFEQDKHGYWNGLTDNFLRVKLSSEKNLKNEFLAVKCNNVEDLSLTAISL
ncbi:tRNA (N(6)-L-threonylcarbamoyladenosine(37)-C(2))-methylthiotransferase MtaB [Candidatus Marinamargulisbacteria bacterium SCGC AAA071-K20]|nr:tRNA (N(6)-L-threonylcarbamoyladenosine(37)-C(2))-methylthiotransferase MtaB [Candidatus Marinamargulisbacteria bacterium SCGC AAA071-K20]